MSSEDPSRQAERSDVHPRPTHAGGLVYRVHGRVAQYLVITAKGQTDEWVLPKGHIEVDETPEEAAVREVAEETGVLAEVVASIQDVSLEVDGIQQRIRFYLMKAHGRSAAGERRKTVWLDAQRAEQRLSYPESRQLMRAASVTVHRLENL